MPKSTSICLWWLKSHNFKLVIGGLNLKLKIGVIKILTFMAINLNDPEKVLTIKSNELSLNPKIIADSLFWLCKVKVIIILNDNDWHEKDEYVVKYANQEKELRKLYDDCWVVLPNLKVLTFLKRTPNDQVITFEAISNYLLKIKGFKRDIVNLRHIIYDEDYLTGVFKKTWREVLVKFDLVEFLEIHYSDIYENFKIY
ncbi:hypothetical protein M2R48_00270 [Acinetobacter sp. I-MWF]|uniref:hypothetical protein n=1 Tax=Acinetobacter sp. I-MWF TaxID=2940517 RepID=UPI0021C91031|nr:hypothetical protein [Acinetobacter sp. I-MWF]MCT9976770.1 hypothetical protein [Acinetobacter sp. I-MWF]